MFFKNDYDLGFKLLTVVGLWPCNNKNPIKNRLFHVYQLSMWIYFLALYQISQYIDLYLSRDNLEKISLNCRSTVTASMLFFNSLELLKKSKSIENLKTLFEKFEDEKKEDFKEVYSDALREMKFLNKIFFGLVYPAITLRLISPFLDRKSGGKKLPTGQWIPFDLKIPSNYLIAWFNQVLEGYFMATYLLGMMFVSFRFLIKIMAEYDTLKKKIEVINVIYDDKKEEKVLKLIKEIIAGHQEILSAIRKFEKLFNMIFFSKVLSFTLLFAINGLNVLFKASKEIRFDLFGEIMYFASTSNYFFVVCYYGSRVYQKSSDIVDLIYDTPWYEMSPDLRKYLLLVIARAQNPPRLTAGNLFKLTLSTYQDMMKMTYQFFMLGLPFVIKTVGN